MYPTEKNVTEEQKERQRAQCRAYYFTHKAESRERNRKWRKLNPEKSKERWRAEARRYRARMDEYKSSRGCALCGESHPACLEFHHVDPKKKERNIGTSAGLKWATILAEISKCTLLCSNCHRKLHHPREN